MKRFNSFGSIIFFKSRCLIQRLNYFLKFRNIAIYKWHLYGTFYCRRYKIQSLKIINSFKADIYIDIGCGLGELLSRVQIPSEYKLGYDVDLSLIDAYNIFNKNKFIFFTNEIELLRYAKNLKVNNNNRIIISMLNFSQNLSKYELESIINKYFIAIGKYTLLIDNIYVNSKEYKYDHHNYLYNHRGMTIPT